MGGGVADGFEGSVGLAEDGFEVGFEVFGDAGDEEGIEAGFRDLDLVAEAASGAAAGDGGFCGKGE